MAGNTNPPVRPVSAGTEPSGAAPPPPPAKKAKGKKEGIPAYMQPPFAKQISRVQAINGKLLEDNTMVRVLRGTSSNDIVYDMNDGALSHTKDLGMVRRFGDIIGRVDHSKVGTRAAAQGTFPSHWRPTAMPNDQMTRPASASSGVAFQRQITRKQDVNGKLLENIEMCRALFGSSASGPEYYERAYDSLMQPLHVSHRPKMGTGQHSFTKQMGRLPLNRTGTRAAAAGTCPSHWEPGMGYQESIPKANQVASFAKQSGRIDDHDYLQGHGWFLLKYRPVRTACAVCQDRPLMSRSAGRGRGSPSSSSSTTGSQSPRCPCSSAPPPTPSYAWS